MIWGFDHHSAVSGGTATMPLGNQKTQKGSSGASKSSGRGNNNNNNNIGNQKMSRLLGCIEKQYHIWMMTIFQLVYDQ
jgi:hypothetical protein